MISSLRTWPRGVAQFTAHRKRGPKGICGSYGANLFNFAGLLVNGLECGVLFDLEQPRPCCLLKHTATAPAQTSARRPLESEPARVGPHLRISGGFMFSTFVMRPCMMRKCGLFTLSWTEWNKFCEAQQRRLRAPGSCAVPRARLEGQQRDAPAPVPAAPCAH